MFQLKFNDDFTGLMREVPYWKREQDIPKEIRNFILRTSSKRILYDRSSEKYYFLPSHEKDSKREFFSSSGCMLYRERPMEKEVDYSEYDIEEIQEELTYYHDFIEKNAREYFAFDVVDQKVYFYTIVEEIGYFRPISDVIYKTSTLQVKESSSYLVEKEGITNLCTHEFLSFVMLDQFVREERDDFRHPLEDSSSRAFKNDKHLDLLHEGTYFYTKNLKDLQNTIYRYSKIWYLEDSLQKAHHYNILQFTLYPLYYPSFEYLMNYRLYRLALEDAFMFRKGKSFQEIFGIEKKYLPFMVENDLDDGQFRIFRIFPTIKDIDVIRFFEQWIDVYEQDMKTLKKEYGLDLTKVKKCMEKSRLTSDDCIEYFDYLDMAKELNLDLHSKEVLYPSDLMEAHDRLYSEIVIIEDETIDRKIKSLSKVLALNCYEDSKYVIYPASSVLELIEESREQKNCVRTYLKKIAQRDCQIYFMREKENLKKSFVTIEVRGKKVVQARAKYNELPSEEVQKILAKWESSLTPIQEKQETE